MPTFINYLRNISGRDGILLSYAIRDLEDANLTSYESFMDKYVPITPFNHGEAYGRDTAEVHTLVVKVINGNEIAEMRINAHESPRNSTINWLTLKQHYRGTDIHAFDIMEVEAFLMIYSIQTRSSLTCTGRNSNSD